MLQKVLLIDDDMVTWAICEMVLKKTEFCKEVEKLGNGKEGIDYFSAYFERKKKGGPGVAAPDLILLDLNMPVMDGWSFLEDYIRKYSDRLPQTKIAILSSTVNPEDFIRAQKYPIVIDFINKPLTIELVEELKSHDAFRPYFE
ncbi:MAG TPA: response regulator [Chitinophagaceae bacterium]